MEEERGVISIHEIGEIRSYNLRQLILMYNSMSWVCDHCWSLKLVHFKHTTHKCSNCETTVSYNCLQLLLQTNHIRTVLSQRGFSSSAPRVWNSLPDKLRSCSSTLDTFQRTLKTHLFSIAFVAYASYTRPRLAKLHTARYKLYLIDWYKYRRNIMWRNILQQIAHHQAVAGLVYTTRHTACKVTCSSNQHVSVINQIIW